VTVHLSDKDWGLGKGTAFESQSPFPGSPAEIFQLFSLFSKTDSAGLSQSESTTRGYIACRTPSKLSFTSK
jgi:hypothetical protein